MSFRKDLVSELKKYEEVIIYGYADIGKTVLDYIIAIDTSIKIANYSGRVKYFATTYSERASLRKEIKGIPIRCIDELVDYAEKALILVATQEKHHKQIGEVLSKYNFKNVMYVRHEDYCEIREYIENHDGIQNTRIGQYQLCHQMKLDRLRSKVKDGKKVKVFFVTHDSAIFGAASVYMAMKEDDLFDPYIYVVSRRDISYQAFYEDVKKDVRFFEERGYKTICGYDENHDPKDIHKYNPDIVFYDIPKLYGSCGSFYNRMDRINWEYLTCYIPYGMFMVDSFFYHYHTTCIRETWRYFLETTDSFKRVMADGDFSGFNLVNCGYPKFDEYFMGKEYSLPEKIDNGKPIVIYAPHHSFGVSNNFATFDLFGMNILKYVSEHPEINFVFKPHPLIKFQIMARYKSGIIDFSPEDYEKYCKEWNSLPNAVIVDEGDYVGLFNKSICMITDCGSFIGEYFPTKNPCIYIFNERKKRQMDVYTPLAEKILSTYYIVNSWKEIKSNMDKIILSQIDEKKDIRVELFNSSFGEIGMAGVNIKNHIKEQII